MGAATTNDNFRLSRVVGIAAVSVAQLVFTARANTISLDTQAFSTLIRPNQFRIMGNEVILKVDTLEAFSLYENLRENPTELLKQLITLYEQKNSENPSRLSEQQIIEYYLSGARPLEFQFSKPFDRRTLQPPESYRGYGNGLFDFSRVYPAIDASQTPHIYRDTDIYQGIWVDKKEASLMTSFVTKERWDGNAWQVVNLSKSGSPNPGEPLNLNLNFVIDSSRVTEFRDGALTIDRFVNEVVGSNVTASAHPKFRACLEQLFKSSLLSRSQENIDNIQLTIIGRKLLDGYDNNLSLGQFATAISTSSFYHVSSQREVDANESSMAKLHGTYSPPPPASPHWMTLAASLVGGWLFRSHSNKNVRGFFVEPKDKSQN